MHCGNCVAKVAGAITGLPGVEVESLSIGNASVRLPADGTVTLHDVLAAVTRIGYPASASNTPEAP
jgi:copper chaperone CopZ